MGMNEPKKNPKTMDQAVTVGHFYWTPSLATHILCVIFLTNKEIRWWDPTNLSFSLTMIHSFSFFPSFPCFFFSSPRLSITGHYVWRVQLSYHLSSLFPISALISSVVFSPIAFLSLETHAHVQATCGLSAQ